MPSLKEVKTRISSVISTQQITKAMKMVAAAKLRKSQDRILQMRPFAQKMTAILQSLSSGGNDGDNWYAKAREEKKVLIIAISSDRGLCGSFNSNVFKGALRVIQEKYAAQHAAKNVVVLPIGKKVSDYFTKRNFPLKGDFANLLHGISFDKVAEAGQYLMDAFQ